MSDTNRIYDVAIKAFQRSNRTRPAQTRNFLALSGGGDDGAFGAGLLVGWSAHGNRPEFDMVTGVSTGALSAPFAFLGRAYDQSLAAMYSSAIFWTMAASTLLSINLRSGALSTRELQ